MDSEMSERVIRELLTQIEDLKTENGALKDAPASSPLDAACQLSTCHCKAVEVVTVGNPIWTAICHCSICRITHSAPYAELCAYPDANIVVKTGADNLRMYNCGGKSKEDRYSCKTCGTKMYSKLNHLGCSAVFLQNFTTPNHGSDGNVAADSPMKMGCHIFYGSGTVSNYDSLDKFDTLPTAFGGDGKTLENEHHGAHGAAKMAAPATAKGSCHCKQVQFETKGEPAWTAICHCSICRKTHSAPYSELVAFGDDDISVTKGADKLVMYNCAGKSKEDRYSCGNCGSKVYSKLNHLGCSAVFMQNFTTPNHGSDGKVAAGSPFQMGCHIFYGSGTVSSGDSLDKFDTLPTAFGGDGKTLANDAHGAL